MCIGRRAEPSFGFPQRLAKETKGKKITPYAKQLALTMFSYASQRTGKVNKSQRELAKRSGMAVDTVNVPEQKAGGTSLAPPCETMLGSSEQQETGQCRALKKCY